MLIIYIKVIWYKIPYIFKPFGLAENLPVYPYNYKRVTAQGL